LFVLKHHQHREILPWELLLQALEETLLCFSILLVDEQCRCREKALGLLLRVVDFGVPEENRSVSFEIMFLLHMNELSLRVIVMNIALVDHRVEELPDLAVLLNEVLRLEIKFHISLGLLIDGVNLLKAHFMTF